MAELGLTFEREDLGGGRHRLTKYLRPIAYDDAGTLRRIDTTWVSSGIAKLPHTVAKAPIKVDVAADGMRRLYLGADKGAYIEIGAPLVKDALAYEKIAYLATAARAGSKLAWDGANTKMQIIHAGHFVKAEVELLNGYAPDTMAFPLTLRGYTLKGETILLDGKPVATLRDPVVYDAANPDGAQQALRWEVAEINKVLCLVLSGINVRGMTRPVIDPTLTLDEGEAGIDADTTLIENLPTDNFGTNATLWCWESGSGYRRQAIFRLDLSSIAAGSTVTSAALTLTKSADGDASTGNIYAILAANSGWTEDGAKWDYATGTTRWAGDTGSNGGSDAGCSVSGTDYNASAIGAWSFAAWGAAPAGTPGDSALNTTQVANACGGNLELILIPTTGIAFCSSDHATASYRPKLVVEYTESGANEDVALTLARTAGLAQSGISAAQSALSFARAAGMAQTGMAASAGAVSFAKGNTVTQSAAAASFGALSLARAEGLTFSGLSAGLGTLTLARIDDLVQTGQAGALGALSLSRTMNAMLNAAAGSVGALTLSREMALVVTGSQLIEVSLTLSRAVTIGASAQAGTNAVLTISLKLAETAGGSAATAAALLLARDAALTALGSWAATAGVTLGRVLVLTSDGSITVSAVVPAERIYTVPAEDRVYTVAAEDRVFVVEAEDRVYVVKRG
jgi:hypothetical protein